MKRFFIIFLFIAGLFFPAYISAQQTVNATITVSPPYTAMLGDYFNTPNKVMITLQNLSPVGGIIELWMKVKITNDNGINITTNPEYKTQIMLSPGAPRILNYSEIQSIFDMNKLDYAGISKSEVLSKGLPSGNFRICIQAMSVFDDHLLSSDEPGGCFSFMVNNELVEPPKLIQPVCGSQLDPSGLQMVLFSWFKPENSQKYFLYTFRLVECYPGQNPNDAMNSATYPYFCEQSTITYTSLIYSSMYPKLHKGKTYAYTITAYDPMNQTQFKNNGTSEVCSFIWGKPDSTFIDPEKPVGTQWSGKIKTKVKGTLVYKYTDAESASYPLKNQYITLKINYSKAKTNGNSSPQTQFLVGNAANYMLQMETEKNNFYSKKKNANILFNAGSYTTINFDKWPMLSQNLLPGVDPSYITTTNDSGKFTFELMLDPWDTIGATYPNPENPSEKLLKYYQLELYNPYYKSPSDSIAVFAGIQKELGIITSYVKCYSLNVNAQQIYKGKKGKVLDSVEVYVLRKTKNSNLPDKEGDCITYPNMFGYKVIAKGITHKNKANFTTLENSYTFQHLVANLDPGDEYMLYACNKTTHSGNFIQYAQNNSNFEPDHSDFEECKYVPSSIVLTYGPIKKTLYYVFSDPPESVVKGTIQYIFPGNTDKQPKPLSHKDVSLVVQYRFKGTISGKSVDLIATPNRLVSSVIPADNNTVLKTVTTGSDGSFVIKFPNTDSLKMVSSDCHNSNTGEMDNKFQGKLERVYRIKVESPYYCSPDDDIKVQPWSDTDAGLLTSYVNSYKLNVTVKVSKQFQSSLNMVNTDSGGVLTGVHLTLTRKMRNGDVPEKEGQGMDKQIEQSTPYTTIVSEDDNDTHGKITFKDLVRSDYIDDCYIITATTSDNSGNKAYYAFDDFYPSKKYPDRMPQALTEQMGSYVFYNSDYTDASFTADNYLKKEYNYEINLEPKKPRVAGRVISSAAPNGVKQAIVQLKELYESPLPTKYRYAVTDSLGYFSIENLDIVLQNQNDPNSLIMPDRQLLVVQSGYQPYGPLDIGRLKWGTQYYDQLISLVPLGKNCKGLVWDSIPDMNSPTLKAPVVSRVKIGDGAFVNTYNPYPGESQYECQKFILDAPTGDNQTLTVVPFDISYPVKTMKVNITKADQWLGDILVNKMYHNVVILVKRLHKQGNSFVKIPVPSAGVRILDYIKLTDYEGKAYFSYTNNSTTEFTAKVYPNQYATFAPVSVSFSNTETPGYQTVEILVTDAVIMKGKVTSATDNTPLVGARVFVDQGNGCDMNFALTNALGDYTLYGVPLYPNTQTIKAVYNDASQHPANPQTYIGQIKTITLLPENSPVTLDFELSKFTALDVSQLLGFPLEIESIKDLGGLSFEVTGAFVNLPSNDNFALADPYTRAPFTKKKVCKGPDKNAQNIPIAVPQFEPIPLDISSIQIKIQNIYSGELRSQYNVLPFETEYPSKKGLIKGLVRIKDNSFIFPSTFMTVTNKDFYLGNYYQHDDNVRMIVPVFKGKGVNYPKTRFSVSKNTGNYFGFKFLGFNGTAGYESYVNGDSLVIDLGLSTSIPGNPPLDLGINAGKVLIHHDGIEPISSNKPISFSLEQWKVNGNNWTLSFNSGGINIASGVIKTTVVDVPFTNMSITPTELILNDYNLSSLSVAGVVPLNITNQPVTTYFGYDKKVGDDLLGHYKLLIMPKGDYPVASFGSGLNMEGLETYGKFRISVISLISNGEQRFSFGDHPLPVAIHKVALVTPLMITSYDNYFTLMGTVDFGIPRVPTNIQCNLKYSKAPDKAKLEFQPVNLSLTGPGGVVFSANSTQVLNEYGFKAEGNIYETGIFNLHSKLYRIPDSGSRIDVEYTQPQSIAYSAKSKLADVTGKMLVKNGDWDNFRFSGKQVGAPGVGTSNPQILDFVVKGDVCAEGQAIGVKNVSIPGGFSGISLLYDYEHSRLTGSMEFNAPFSGVQVQGMANVVFDNDGWYFLAGGKLTSPGMGTLSAGIMFGDYNSFPGDMQSKLMQFAYNKNIPCDFQKGVHGFFITGMKTLPLSIPEYNLDLGITSIHLGAEAGLDARIYMNFNDGGAVFGAGAMVFAHAYFSLDSYFCTSITADARAELLVTAEYHTDTKTLSGTACGSVSVKGSVEQCIGAFGLCGPCLSASIKESLKVELSVDTDQGFHGFSIGTGDCSKDAGKPCK